MGAPITGMIVLGVVQTGAGAVDDLADAQRAVQRAGEPRGGHQRHSLHRLAVRAVRDDEDREGRLTASTRATRVIAVLLRMGYSVFALYASGKDAVMGGMLVLGIVYIVWGFIANRFTGAAGRQQRTRGEGMRRETWRTKSSAMFAAPSSRSPVRCRRPRHRL